MDKTDKTEETLEKSKLKPIKYIKENNQKVKEDLADVRIRSSDISYVECLNE